MHFREYFDIINEGNRKFSFRPNFLENNKALENLNYSFESSSLTAFS